MSHSLARGNVSFHDILRQDICTRILATTLDYKISDSLMGVYRELYTIMSNLSSITDFKNERTNLQVVGMKYRILNLKEQVMTLIVCHRIR